jgi:hypothetical protein
VGKNNKRTKILSKYFSPLLLVEVEKAAVVLRTRIGFEKYDNLLLVRDSMEK